MIPGYGTVVTGMQLSAQPAHTNLSAQIRTSPDIGETLRCPKNPPRRRALPGVSASFGPSLVSGLSLGLAGMKWNSGTLNTSRWPQAQLVLTCHFCLSGSNVFKAGLFDCDSVNRLRPPIDGCRVSIKINQRTTSSVTPRAFFVKTMLSKDQRNQIEKSFD